VEETEAAPAEPSDDVEPSTTSLISGAADTSDTATGAAAPAEPAAEPVSLPFSDEDWEVLRETVAAAERPLSFQQIHDRLRSARNATSRARTNEELRTQIKQAINTGILQRQGKGARATYRLAPAEAGQFIAPAETEPVEAGLPELRLPPPDSTDEPAEVAPVDVEGEVTPVAVQPTAIVALDEEPAPAEAAPATRPRSRSRKKAAEQPAAPEPTPAKRSRSRGKAAEPAVTSNTAAAAEPTPAPTTAEAPAAAEAEAAPAKRTRRRKKPAEPTEE
jgi:hypothetical protein